jgi:hypothetical protein
MGKKLIFGFGINDLEKVSENGKHLKFYTCWTSMLVRCYSKKYQEKHSTYYNCRVSDEWIYLSNFKKFYDMNYKDGYQLDKDILFPGNKIYSEHKCVFIPRYLNTLLTDCGAARGEYPLGINKRKNLNLSKPYIASCRNGLSKQIYKAFKTAEEAQEWYIETKKQIVLQQIERAKVDGFNNEAVFEALIKREWC